MSDPAARGPQTDHIPESTQAVDPSQSSETDLPDQPGDASQADGEGASDRKRRRGSRGGRNRSRGARPGNAESSDSGDSSESGNPDELPERSIEGRPKSTEAAAAALVGTPEGEREKQSTAPDKPKIGDSRPAPSARPKIGDTRPAPEAGEGGDRAKDEQRPAKSGSGKRRRRRGGRNRGGKSGRAPAQPVEVRHDDEPVELDDEILEKRRGQHRKGKPVGRYAMVVHVAEDATQIAVLEGRRLIEHYVSRPSDDIFQIHGNVYLGRVQNVLPGMEAAFIDIGTPKNAVLYHGDVQYEKEDLVNGSAPRIEQMLQARQSVLCQVTKNPIAHKGARLTQEVSLPGRFCVLVPNSTTYGISKRLPDAERKRLRAVLDRVKPSDHGIIVRTAAENVTEEEIERDVTRLLRQWDEIKALADRAKAPALLYREPDLAIRFIREEFNRDYRTVVIDDRQLYDEMRSYVESVAPALADRIEYYDDTSEALPLFERHHVTEQLRKALDKKVWLPSGGSLIVEHTEALTVIDVNTGKNVGSKNLEETVFHNNLEAADEIARQLRLRDIGGIIVIDFIDMEIRENRDKVIKAFREALSRDKTRTQVFDISELGLVEMTRKRIGEGLLESLTHICESCDGRGLHLAHDLIEL